MSLLRPHEIRDGGFFLDLFRIFVLNKDKSLKRF
jgi:hypothetical protein